MNEVTSVAGPAAAMPRRRLADRLPGIVKLFLFSKGLQSTAVFACGGAAFALGNLFLARALLPEDYGRFSLFFALFVVGSHFAPFGYDQLLLRREIDPGAEILRRILTPALITAVITGAVAVAVYGMAYSGAAVLGLVVFAGAYLWAGACAMRRNSRLFAGIALDTTPDWLVFSVGTLALLVAMEWGHAAVIFAIALVAATLVGWRLLMRDHRVPPERRQTALWQEALPLLGISVAGAVLVQTERLIIPKVLSLEELALFGVLASTAIAPFRMLSAGLGYSLTHDLRGAPDRAARWRVLKREMLLAGSALLAATMVVCTLAPFVIRLIAGEHYVVDLPLLLAACVNGAAKISHGLSRAILIAVGTPAQLRLLTLFVWGGIGLGAIGAVIGGQHSLFALLLGAAIGTMAGAVPAGWLAARAVLPPGHP